jgi:hypothetical protein
MRRRSLLGFGRGIAKKSKKKKNCDVCDSQALADRNSNVVPAHLSQLAFVEMTRFMRFLAGTYQ